MKKQDKYRQTESGLYLPDASVQESLPWYASRERRLPPEGKRWSRRRCCCESPCLCGPDPVAAWDIDFGDGGWTSTTCVACAEVAGVIRAQTWDDRENNLFVMLAGLDPHNCLWVHWLTSCYPPNYLSMVGVLSNIRDIETLEHELWAFAWITCNDESEGPFDFAEYVSPPIPGVEGCDYHADGEGWTELSKANEGWTDCVGNLPGVVAIKQA